MLKWLKSLGKYAPVFVPQEEWEYRIAENLDLYLKTSQLRFEISELKRKIENLESDKEANEKRIKDNVKEWQRQHDRIVFLEEKIKGLVQDSGIYTGNPPIVLKEDKGIRRS